MPSPGRGGTWRQRSKDVIRERLLINRVVVRITGQVIVKGKAKTAKSHGWVPLSPALKQLVGAPLKGYVLGGKVPVDPRRISERLAWLVKGTALEGIPGMGPHALRRTFGMTLLESGADVVTASDMMRHDPSMLLNEYSRTREDLKRTAVEKAFPEHVIEHTKTQKEWLPD